MKQMPCWISSKYLLVILTFVMIFSKYEEKERNEIIVINKLTSD
jgi:hypothetical protein